MKRSATAIWKGSGAKGHGNLSTQSKVLDQTQYSFSSRFEQGTGTNPEELIAAAHAGCFNMKLSFVLGNKGFTPDQLETSCVITIDDSGITSSELTLVAKVAGIDDRTFQEAVKDAEENCPISQLFNTKISVDYSLVETA